MPPLKPKTQAPLETILGLLPRLSAKDREQVRQRLIALATLDLGPKARDHDPTDWLLDGIVAELTARGLETSIPPKGAWPKLLQWKQYCAARPGLESWAVKRAPTFTRTDWAVFGLTAARVLATHLTAFTEVNIRTMLAHANELPEALQRAFPGYAESRLLGFIIKAQRRNLTQKAPHG